MSVLQCKHNIWTASSGYGSSMLVTQNVNKTWNCGTTLAKSLITFPWYLAFMFGCTFKWKYPQINIDQHNAIILCGVQLWIQIRSFAQHFVSQVSANAMRFVFVLRQTIHVLDFRFIPSRFFANGFGSRTVVASGIHLAGVLYAVATSCPTIFVTMSAVSALNDQPCHRSRLKVLTVVRFVWRHKSTLSISQPPRCVACAHDQLSKRRRVLAVSMIQS